MKSVEKSIKHYKNSIDSIIIKKNRGFPGGAVVENRLPMQGTRVRALVQEDPTCHGAAKPGRHNY